METMEDTDILTTFPVYNIILLLFKL